MFIKRKAKKLNRKISCDYNKGTNECMGNKIPVMFVKTQIVKVKATVDTGSTVTVIKRDFANSLQKSGWAINEDHGVLKTVNGKKVQIEDEVNLQFENCKYCVALVCNTNVFEGDILLESDFLESNDAEVNFAKRIVVIRDRVHHFKWWKKKPLQATLIEESLASAETVDRQSIPQESQALLVLKVHPSYVGKCVMVEPLPKFTGAIGKSLCIVVKAFL